jgi:hypothetical protein
MTKLESNKRRHRATSLEEEARKLSGKQDL